MGVGGGLDHSSKYRWEVGVGGGLGHSSKYRWEVGVGGGLGHSSKYHNYVYTVVSAVKLSSF